MRINDPVSNTRWRNNNGGVVTKTLLLIWISIPVCSSLLCYQCATTNKDDDCITSYGTFINATRKGTLSPYVKNCTDSNPVWDRCMIETLRQDGKYTHYHRGCHDGKTFGKQFESPRFKNITPNNETTCDRVVVLACYSFCDTDLCNGPQISDLDRGNNTCSDPYGGQFCSGNTIHGGLLFLSVLLVLITGLSWI